MILNAIYNGELRPEEMGFMDEAKYRDAMREVGLFRSMLMESIDQEDRLLLEQLVAQLQCAEAIACSRSFQYGFAAGLVLMQEAQALVQGQDISKAS